MKELKSLYNGILNDASIQRFSLGWKTVLELIEKKYKTIERTNEEFNDKLLKEALSKVKGSLHSAILSFMRELHINLETLRNK